MEDTFVLLKKIKVIFVFLLVLWWTLTLFC
jgi:hypothetical protein